MTARASSLTYPREGFGAPKDRHGSATGSVGLPAGTRAIRIAFLPNDDGNMKFPTSVQLHAFRNR